MSEEQINTSAELTGEEHTDEQENISYSENSEKQSESFKEESSKEEIQEKREEIQEKQAEIFHPGNNEPKQVNEEVQPQPEPEKATNNEDNNKIEEIGNEGSSLHEIGNYDLTPTLVQRLGNYAIVNTAFTTYDYIKNSNYYLKVGLTSAENASAVALAYTAPVVVPHVQPYLNSLDEKFGVEQKGHLILDNVEAKYATATDLVNNTTNYIVDTKQAVLNIPQKSYQIFVDRPIEQLLDSIEVLMNKLLPPTFPVETVSIPSDETELTKYSRICTIGYEVPKRLVNLAQQKYPQLHLTEEQLQSFAFLVDLIQYAVDTIDSQGRQVINKANNAVVDGKQKVESKLSDLSSAIREKSNSVNTNYVSPIKVAIEEGLAEIQNSDLKTYAGVMATIAHASELAKRQLYMKLGDPQNLLNELKNYLDSSKKMITNFDKTDISNLLASLKSNASLALTHILTLISNYAPKDLIEKLPSLANISLKIENWRLTIEQRLLAFQNEATTAIEANKETTNNNNNQEEEKK